MSRNGGDMESRSTYSFYKQKSEERKKYGIKALSILRKVESVGLDSKDLEDLEELIILMM